MSAASLSKSPQTNSELVAYASKFGKPLLFWALYGGRILKAPVEALGGGREDRATLLGVVTNGDDIIEMLSLEFVNRFGAVV